MKKYRLPVAIFLYQGLKWTKINAYRAISVNLFAQ